MDEQDKLSELLEKHLSGYEPPLPENDWENFRHKLNGTAGKLKLFYRIAGITVICLLIILNLPFLKQIEEKKGINNDNKQLITTFPPSKKSSTISKNESITPSKNVIKSTINHINSTLTVKNKNTFKNGIHKKANNPNQKIDQIKEDDVKIGTENIIDKTDEQRNALELDHSIQNKETGLVLNQNEKSQHDEYNNSFNDVLTSIKSSDSDTLNNAIPAKSDTKPVTSKKSIYMPIDTQLTKSQLDSINRLAKYMIGTGIGGQLVYGDDGSGINYILTVHPKFGYLVTPNFMPYLGIDAIYGKTSLAYDTINLNLFAISPGMRYYITKRKLLYFETGVQLGKARTINKGNIDESFNFIQAGLGIGLNFSLPQRNSNGRTELEFMYRYNFNLLDRPASSVYDMTLKTLGTSFGLNYKFSSINPKPLNSRKDLKKTIVGINSLHSLKANISRLSYTYELALGKATALDFEISTTSLIDLYSSDSNFMPCLKIEPRYYYNYNRRFQNGLKIKNNSSDYFAIETSYMWLWKYEPSYKFWQFSVIPKWGLRRPMGKHFIFEFEMGASIYTSLYENIGIKPHLNATIGFCF